MPSLFNYYAYQIFYGLHPTNNEKAGMRFVLHFDSGTLLKTQLCTRCSREGSPGSVIPVVLWWIIPNIDTLSIQHPKLSQRITQLNQVYFAFSGWCAGKDGTH